MASEEYLRLLKDPRWQRKRLEKLQDADWTCSCCGIKEKTLHVHHPKYRHGAMPWEYELDELEVLCDDCHEAFHAAKNELSSIVGSSNCYVLRRLMGYAQALLAIEGERSPVIGPVWSSADAAGISDALRTPHYPCWFHEIEEMTNGGSSVDISVKIEERRLASVEAKRKASGEK